MLLDLAIEVSIITAEFLFYPVYVHRKNSLALWGMKKNKLE